MFRIMLGIIPYASCAILWIFLLAEFSRPEKPASKRGAMILTALISGIWLVLGTELLSYFYAIKFVPILLWWTIPAVAMLVVYLARFGFKLPPIKIELPENRATIFILSAVLCLLWAVSLYIAWKFPPNNSDVMHYHLPRQIFWMENHTVRHFRAQDLRLLYNPPMAEFEGLHLMILSHSDRWANIPQWLSFVGCALAASYAVKLIGGKAPAQIFAAFCVAVLPSAFVQASSAKNDLFEAFWIMAVMCVVLQMYATKRAGVIAGLMLGAAAGLAFFTKGTAFIYLAPVVIFASLPLIRVCGWKPAISAAATALVVFIAINACHWSRNYTMFHSLTTPDMTGTEQEHYAKYNNEVYSVPQFASNVVRNLTLHMSTVNDMTPRLVKAVTWIHDHILHIDVSDQRTTWWNTSYALDRAFYNEDRVGASVHMILGFVVLVALVRGKYKPVSFVAIIPIAAFLLFCFVLKWQPWHTRLHIPIFIMLAIPVGYLVGLEKRMAGPWVVAVIAIAVLYPTMLWNVMRPLFLSNYQLWTFNYTKRDAWLYGHGKVDAYHAMNEEILSRDLKIVGLQYSFDQQPYKMMAGIVFDPRWHGRFVYTGGWKMTTINNLATAKPDLCISDKRNKPLETVYWNAKYIPVKDFGTHSVCIPADRLPATMPSTVPESR